MVYSYVLGRHQGSRVNVGYFFPKGLTPPPQCSKQASLTSTCACSKELAYFFNPDFMGQVAALEMLAAFKTNIGWHLAHYDWPRYWLHWNDLAAFTDRKLFHLGYVLHDLFPDMHLSIYINFTTDKASKNCPEQVGLSDAADTEVAKFAVALSDLSNYTPRKVTFSFHDDVDHVPENMDFAFRMLSQPFRQLKDREFEVRTRYVAGESYGGLGEWNIGSGCWDIEESDVWQWALHDWNLNFTQANEFFQPRSMWGDDFNPNPHGPLRKQTGDYTIKIPVWESIRRYLYRAFPEVEQAVRLVDRGEGEMYVDCGCETGRHSCSDYYLCREHGGWDEDIGGKNTYCYKCLGIVASEQPKE